MKRTIILGCLLLAGVRAQDTTLYRLQFTIRETETGKPPGTRTYTMQVRPMGSNKIDAGAKIPVATGAANQGFTYLDIGVSVRARLEERAGQLLLGADVEVSDIEQENAGALAARIRKLRVNVDTAVPPGQATPIATLDDPSGKRHYEIQVAATKVK